MANVSDAPIERFANEMDVNHVPILKLEISLFYIQKPAVFEYKKVVSRQS